jgi:hypothetical protein
VAAPRRHHPKPAGTSMRACNPTEPCIWLPAFMRGEGAVGRAPSASMRVRSCEVSTRVHSYDVFCLSSLCARDATLLLRCGCGGCCSAAPQLKHKWCFRRPDSILRRRLTLHVTARDAARRRAADAAPRRRRVQQGQLCEFSRRWVVKIIRAW